MLVKSVPVKHVKVLQDPANPDDPGTFEALVSVFDNVDSYGDVVRKGAFSETIREWEESPYPMPVLYSHRSDDPDYNIGHVLEAKETDEGLLIRGKLDVDSETGKAKQVHRLLTTGRVAQFSFAYDIREAGWGVVDGLDVYELKNLKVYEVGPCLIGANQETRLIGAKDAGDPGRCAASAVTRLAGELKAGRVLSAENETRLRTAVEELSAVLSAVGNDEDDTTDDDASDDASETADDEDSKSRAATTKSRLPDAEALERELAALV